MCRVLCIENSLLNRHFYIFIIYEYRKNRTEYSKKQPPGAHYWLGDRFDRQTDQIGQLYLFCTRRKGFHLT
jgi:hypothetical protein